MGSCAYVPPVVRKKQEIVELAIELEEMGELDLFVKLVLEYDILDFYEDNNASITKELSEWLQTKAHS